MKFKVLKDFRVLVQGGKRVSGTAGEFVFLTQSQAVPLLKQKKIEIVSFRDFTEETKKGFSYRIYSKKLEDYLWVVQDENTKRRLIRDGVTETIYTQEESKRIKDSGMSIEGLIAIHKVMSNFPGANVFRIADLNMPG